MPEATRRAILGVGRFETVAYNRPTPSVPSEAEALLGLDLVLEQRPSGQVSSDSYRRIFAKCQNHQPFNEENRRSILRRRRPPRDGVRPTNRPGRPDPDQPHLADCGCVWLGIRVLLVVRAQLTQTHQRTMGSSCSRLIRGRGGAEHLAAHSSSAVDRLDGRQDKGQRNGLLLPLSATEAGQALAAMMSSSGTPQISRGTRANSKPGARSGRDSDSRAPGGLPVDRL